MVMIPGSKTSTNSSNSNIIKHLVEFVTICNAIKNGWKVKKIGSRKYELTKKIQSTFDFNDFDLHETIIRLVD